jgi:ABC-2 type transport system permease protein
MIPYLFFSGLVAPLQAFPPGLRQLALHTPFPYLIAFPAELLAGESVAAAGPFSTVNGFLSLLIWLAVLFPLLLLLWRAGVRRYGAMGA